jgi:hypothetical protein
MLLFCTTTVINAQIVRKKKINYPLEIYVEEFDLWLPNFKSYPDTIVRKLNDSTYIKMVLRSPKGTLEFYTYNLPVQYGHWEFKTKKGEIPRKETYLKADYP